MSVLVLFIVVMVAMGLLLRTLGLVRLEAAQDLNQIVFAVTLPPLIFQALHRATLSWHLLLMPAIAWAAIAGAIGLGFLVSRLLRLPRTKTGAFLLALSFSNTTYLGYPYIKGFYGTHHLTLAIFFDLMGATIAANTIGPVIAGLSAGKAIEPLAVLKRLMRFPPIYALILGLAMHGILLPGWLETILDRLANLTSPLIMLSIGLTLKLDQLGQDLRLVMVAVVGRLLVLPLLLWGALRLFRVPLDYEQAAVMQAAMPTMFYTLALALLFRLEVSLAVNTIMISTLLSFLTLPLWHWLLG